MKKKNIINLIKFYTENNDSAFRSEAYEIACDFDKNGDSQLAEYIMMLLSGTERFVPQTQALELVFLEKIESFDDFLFIPEEITNDLIGAANAIERHIGINKFLFAGEPGTGKTEAAKQLARILNRTIYVVDFSRVIDSKLGQTQKNISDLIKEVNKVSQNEKAMILFDEIDALALDRTNNNDVREMGRATSALLKGLDNLNDHAVIIATTNLYNCFDKALIRRFDSVIDFNRYTEDDLLLIAEKMLDRYLIKMKLGNRDIRLFRKIIKLFTKIPYPGDLKNIIKTAIAFSDVDDGYDYFRRLYYAVCGHKPTDIKDLQLQGFTVREIEVLTTISKSSVSRGLNGGDANE